MKKMVLFLAALVLFLSACSDDDNPTNTTEWRDDAVSASIEYDEDAVVLDDDHMSYLQSFDSTSFTYVFNSSAPEISEINEGDIVIFGNTGIRKVKKITQLGPTYSITTEFVPITEAIKNCDISWDYGVDLTPESAIAGLKKHDAQILVLTKDSLDFEFSKGSFKVIGSLKFLTHKTNIKLEFIKKQYDKDVGKLSLEGYFQRFRTTGNIKIANHELENYDNDIQGNSAEFTVTVINASSGSDQNFEIPFTLLKAPIVGIPFLNWELKFLAIFNAYVPNGGSTLMQQTFTYNADQGFQYKKGQTKAEPSANLKSHDLKNGENDNHAGAASTMQVAWGLAMPRFEVTFTGTTIAWFHTAFLFDGYYRFNPACQKVAAHFYGAAGWGLGAFGITIASSSAELWHYKKDIVNAGNCPD